MKKKTLFIALILNLFFAGAQGFDYIPYQGIYKEMHSEHFTVLFTDRFRERAVQTLRYSEDIHLKIKEYLKWAPDERVILILTDDTDLPNGLSTVMPRNTVILNMVSLDRIDSLRDADDPLYSLILHELAHIYHLDQVSGAALFWRVLYGRLYFPNQNSFSWMHEGVAVNAESDLAAGGRLDGSYYKTILKEFIAKRGKIPSYDMIVYDVKIWPNNELVYCLGSEFLRYLRTKYGEEKFNAFITDNSNDFFPFVFEFVMKFRKIYGKPLGKLWQEWSDSLAAGMGSVNVTDDKDLSNTLFTFDGSVDNLRKRSDGIYFIGRSKRKGSGIFVYNNGKISKVADGEILNYGFTPGGLIFNRLTYYTGGYTYYDLYVKKGLSVKKLTSKFRVGYFDYDEDRGFGVLTKDNDLYRFSIGADDRLTFNKIETGVKFNFIERPSISPSGDVVLFSARTENNYEIYRFDLRDNRLTLENGVNGKYTKWAYENSYIFVATGDGSDGVYYYDILTKRSERVTTYNSGFIYDIFTADDRVLISYYNNSGAVVCQDYLANSEESSIPQHTTGRVKTDEVDISKEKLFNPFVYLKPEIYGLLPVVLDSTFEINRFKFNNIAPGVFIYNREPLGFFNYFVTLTYDYGYRLPEVSGNLQWYLPYGFSINYSFSNNASQEIYFGRHSNELSNSIGLVENVMLNNYNYLTLAADGTAFLKENGENPFIYDTSFYLSQSLSYTAVNNVKYLSRWNRGINVGVYGYEKFAVGNSADNYYAVKAVLKTRYPFLNNIFFTDNSAGYDLTGKGKFYVTTDMINIYNGLLGGVAAGAFCVDTKAFAYQLGNIFFVNDYIACDIGIDSQFYKGTQYAHFLTFGFKEIYARNFVEFVAVNLSSSPEFLVDIATEIGVDLFITYGNIDVTLVTGASAGYTTIYNGFTANLYLTLNFGL